MRSCQGILIAGTLAGGLLALGIGPRATAACGAALAATGHAALAAGAPLLVGAGVVSFGAGVLCCAPYTAAAEVLAWDDESPAPPGPHRFAAVAAYVIATSAAMNVGGVLGPLLHALSNERFTLVYAIAAAATLMAALLAAASAGLGLLGRRERRDAAATGPYRATAMPSGGASHPFAGILGVLILLVPQVVYFAGEATSPPLELLRTASERTWLFMVGPISFGVASLALLAVLVVAATQRSTRPPLALYGAGLVTFALGLAVIAAAGSSSAALWACGAAVAGIGGAAAGAVPLAYAAIAVRGRAATLVVAGWKSVASVVGAVASSLAALEMLRGPLLWVCALLALAGGVALARYARVVHARFFTTEAPVGAE